jgi:hypothetical protein
MVDADFLFVVGVGRSGTSLLQSMLAAHGDYAFPPETGFVRRFIASRLMEKTYRRGRWAAVQYLLESDERVVNTGVDARQVVSAASSEDGFSAFAVYQAFLNEVRKNQGRPRVGDKEPRAIESLRLLGRHFPRSRVIHVIRDPRDVLVSKKKAQWSRTGHPLRHMVVGSLQFRMGVTDGPRAFGQRYMELRYEDLLDSPIEVLANVCKFLEVPFRPEMLQFDAAARSLVSAREMQWKKETLGPLLRHNRGKWATELDAKEAMLTEMICRECMEHCRYPRADETDMAWTDRLGARIAAFCVRAGGWTLERALRARELLS